MAVDIRYLDYAGNILGKSQTSTNTIDGTSGADVLTGTDNADLLRGNGAAIYAMNTSLDRMSGGLGDDTYYVHSTRSVVIEADGEGIDTVRTTANYILPDHVENLTINGYTGYSGTTGIGNAGANVIIGDTLAQMIDGRAGNDVITGGGGGDTFIFQPGSGHDVITDFTAGTKAAKVSLGGYAVTNYADIQSKMTQAGSDVVLTLSDNDSITFRNTTIDKFSAANFTLPHAMDGLQLTFSEEFDGPLSLFDYATGTGKWVTNYGWGSDPDGRISRSLGSVNGERQIYVDPLYQGTGSAQLNLNPFNVHDGILDLTASKMPDAAKSSLYNYDYTSGLLSTRVSFTQTYGYYEAKMKLPSAEGSWPAFWLFGSSSKDSSEIDIVEGTGGNPGLLKATMHDSSLAKYDQNTLAYYVPDATTAFHTYGMQWDADHITYYVDNRQVYQTETPANMHRPMYVILNLAVGASGGKANPDQFPATLSVDYIRAYRLQDQVSPEDPSDVAGTTSADALFTTTATKTMAGLAGNDTYFVDHPDAVITEGVSGGVDTVMTSLLSYKLADNVENLTYTGPHAFIGTGNDLNNVIIGGIEGDRLNGGKGIDTMMGGAGNDIYFVDDARDIVIEADGNGYDTIYSSAANYKLAAGQMIEVLVGVGPGIYALTGNEHVNRIVGTNDVNRIDGGLGPDTMEGRGGSDYYVVDNVGDVIIERENDGYDTVATALSSYTLAQNVEALVYTGSGNFTGVGNALANSITGGAGNDRLNGNGGNDLLIGRDGNDSYVIASAGITIIEKENEGFDDMVVLIDNAMAASNIELMTYRGGGNFTGYANKQGTQIVGGAGNDSLIGNIGNDVLDGRGGNNLLRGNAGQDTFVLSAPGTGTARIVDFQSGEDHIAVNASAFNVTSLSDVRFVLGDQVDPLDGHPTFLYTSAGNLYFNATGDSNVNSVLVASFDFKPILHDYDFLIA